MDKSQLIETGKQVIRLEAREVERLADRIGEEFARAVELLVGLKGRAIVSGVGKSGIIARKLAATLTSTGTPAFFLHPVEGLHGDVGMVLRDDLLILISKSGESEELFDLLRAVKRLGVPIITFTGSRGSTLADYSDILLDVAVEEEACPHDLAPTASTTAALAMSDALAVSVLTRKGFGQDDFAKLHPGGKLGRQLLKVSDLMVSEPDKVPWLAKTATLREAMLEIAFKRGTVPIVDDERRIIGVITAGDLTRFVDNKEEFFHRQVSEAMNPNPKTVRCDTLAVEAVYLMEKHGIMALPVEDADERLAGMVHLHDLMRARVV
ncbi:MAG: KpsF/GutQ family sugar-phosphate isomerase [Gemmatimonadetes bacterium]|uniref:KpsF/GutQ family sugar-phosphate isomerase n=1 Tax=Candidatus Kutchimonas denitrificans TaxID=3056748 RepID=A0AAE5C987_9BACT|nr:KpsF/GutQ family sugar-phosphate isomerase [Gemmatimonadota bacterium]NIR75241.1 KpsF/GutQ family sugar-phosphate isomerase [Candidatus Kutchimonas denitrificans]NIS00179.1 KpsF/GutQ family sugar-phosphate isomerase [Gemmatimonadota bacterium]NIT65771.1 KpsF/GutQ family sugar-phosphate isomerase [Gemmatimonadota bacterium]NIU53049.1 KpsF/GutQ family sugar-phosphate isomerase [Gemmatimonadota bacterium]